MPVRIYAALACLLIWAASARADSITTSASGTVGAVSLSDADSSPPGPAVIASSITFPGGFLGPIGGRGAAGLFGSGGLVAATAGGFIANGVTGNTIEANAAFELTPVNTSGGPLAYTFAFTIAPITLSIADFANIGAGSPEAPRASYSIQIALDGSPIFTSGAEYRGGRISRILTPTGVDLGGAFSESGATFSYTTPVYTGSLGLGTFADGVGFTLSYTARVAVVTPGFEIDATASFGDPTDLFGTGSGGSFLLSGGTLPPGGGGGTGGGGEPVPEPSTFLLCAAVAGWWCVRRRRR